MLCALTVRRLKPGTYDQFHDAFLAGMEQSDPPPGWVRFDMVRNTEDPDEVIMFGLFDGTVDDLRGRGQDRLRRAADAIAPYVESVGSDGLYEVMEDWVTAPQGRA